MKVTVCMGSSCHIKGAKDIVDRLRVLIADNGLDNRVDLCGAFCMGNCVKGVSVKVDDEQFSVDPCSVDDFFADEVSDKMHF